MRVVLFSPQAPLDYLEDGHSRAYRTGREAHLCSAYTAWGRPRSKRFIRWYINKAFA
jgi:hypothetical protein